MIKKIVDFICIYKYLYTFVPTSICREKKIYIFNIATYGEQPWIWQFCKIT